MQLRCKVYNIEWDLSEFLEENPEEDLTFLKLPKEIEIIIPDKYKKKEKLIQYIDVYLNCIYKIQHAGFSYSLLDH